jgi:hypothetical protein
VYGEVCTEELPRTLQGQQQVGVCIFGGKLDNNVSCRVGCWLLFNVPLVCRYSLIKKHMKKNEEGKLSPFQHLTASAEAGW